MSKNIQTTNAERGVERWELSYTIGGNVNGYNQDGEDMEVPQEKLYAELPYESAIPFQCIYSEKTIIQKGTCTPGFPEALFTITKTEKPPKYLQTDG